MCMKSRKTSLPRTEKTAGKTRITPAQYKELRMLLGDLRADPRNDPYQIAQSTLSRLINSPPQPLLSGVDTAYFTSSLALSAKALSGYATLYRGHVRNIEAMLAK